MECRAETIKQVQRITIDEGLSQSTVSSIYQVLDGRMWFATGDGISIYDGESFQYIYRQDRTDRGLQSNYISKVSQDKDGHIWVGTQGGGISIFDTKGEFLLGFFASDASPPMNDVYDFSWGQDGKVWVATAAGVLSLSPEESWWQSNSIHKLPEPVYPVASSSVLAMENGEILIGTKSQGIAVFQPEGEGVLSQYSTDNSALKGNHILELFHDDVGGVWIATEDGGLNFLQTQTGVISQPVFLPDKDVESITQGSDGRMWFGTWSNGIFVYDPANGTTENYRAHSGQTKRLGSNSIVALAVGSMGKVWAGSYDAGVFCLSESPDVFTTLYEDPTGKTGPVSGMIWAIEEGRNNDFWVGTKAGLVRYFPETQKFEPISLGSNSQDVRAILKMNNSILLGIRSWGLVEYFEDSGIVKEVRDADGNNPFKDVFVRLLLRAQNGDIWVGTHNGVYRLNKNLQILTHYDEKSKSIALPHNRVRSLYQAPDGAIWIGTSGGLSRLNQNASKIQTFSGPQYFQDNDVRAVWQNPNGKIYVATQAGLSIFNAKMELIKRIQRNDGLPNETLYSLLPDKLGNLWITTNNGLVKFDLADESIKIYRTKDGLQGAEFNFNAHTILSDGNVVVGGINGFSLFDPSQLDTNMKPPAVLFSTSGSPLKSDAPANINFDIKVIHYDDPAGNSLHWKLEPIEPNWNIEKGVHHKVRKENLPAGDYTFSYKAFSSNNVAVGERKFDFTVQLPFYLRWYTILLYALGLLAAGYSGHLLRTRYLQRRNLALKALVHEKTKELVHANQELEATYQEKSKFYARAAHEIRTPISLIKGPLQSIENSQSLDRKNSELLGLVKRAVNRLVHLTDEMIFVTQHGNELPLKSDSLDLQSFIEPIVNFYRDSAKAKGILFNAKLACHGAVTMDAEALDVVLHNLLSNAVKYTDPGNKIEIELSRVHNCIVIRITNDGELPKEALFILQKDQLEELTPAQRGCRIIASMVKRANGEIVVHPKPVEVIVHLPILHGTALNSGEISKLPKSKPSNILVIEDDAQLRDYLASSLEEMGNIQVASSCSAARRKIETSLQHLIICDVMLPDGSGFDLVREIKERPETSHIPAIFLTALADADSYKKGLEAWADDYITKPFDVDELKAKVTIRLRNIEAIRAHVRSQNLHFEVSAENESINIIPADQRLIARIEEAIREELAKPEFSIDTLAKLCATSKRNLQRKLDALYDMNFTQLLAQRRMEKASELLKRQMSIKEVCWECGYRHPSSFTRKFKLYSGKLPSEYRQGA